MSAKRKKGPKRQHSISASAVNRRLNKLVLQLDPTTNVTTVAMSVYSQITKSDKPPSFVSALKKYGPEFISPLMKGRVDQIGVENLNKKIEERLAARLAKNWSLADDIRKELEKRGVTLRDSAQGTTWSVPDDPLSPGGL